MKSSFSLLILAVCASAAIAQEQVSIKDVVTNQDRRGVHRLDVGYRGTFTNRFNEDGHELPLEDEEFEFTHAFFSEAKQPEIEEETLPINEIVVGLEEKNSTGSLRYRAPAVSLHKLPEFQELTQLKEIADYERVFGKSRGLQTGWGGDGHWYSSLGWMGFVSEGDNAIRVVSVFLHTENKGDGWKIRKRHVSEGLFRSTGAPPKLEVAEQSDKPPSPNRAISKH